MIRLISIDIAGFINNWLPVHKRKIRWLSFFQVLLVPFRLMMAEWKQWRDSAITRAYVSSQKLSIEWYLNELFDPVDRGIYIDTPAASGLYLALETELTPVLLAGLETEPAELGDYEYVPLPGEDVEGGMADFIVYVPADLAMQEDAIRRVVISYKLAGKSWTIIYF